MWDPGEGLSTWLLGSGWDLVHSRALWPTWSYFPLILGFREGSPCTCILEDRTRSVPAMSRIHTHPFVSSTAGLAESHVTDGFSDKMGPSGEGEKKQRCGPHPGREMKRRDSRASGRVLVSRLEACRLGREAGLWGKVWFGSGWKIRFSWAANTPTHSGSTNSG